MERENNSKANSVIKPGNLSVDTSLVDQPQGSTRFALNVVNEIDGGDKGLRIIENSNESCYTLPAGTTLAGKIYTTTPLGKVYIGNNETMIFSVSNIGDSYISIVDANNNLRTIVTDQEQIEKFGFKINKQIEATFRLRRGCERTIYFIDPKPRRFVIEKLSKYKNPNDTWNISDFNLFKKYSKIPNFENITVDETGDLANGSYNASVQYLDEDLNPTEFITSSKVVKIYNSNTNSVYRDIRGGTAEVNAYLNFGKTGKSITFKFSNLDTNYPFYRLAITEANAGNGEISATKYTAEISTTNETFTYTGNNYETLGTQVEILAFDNIIDEAKSIEQIENILILADIKGKDINYCNLQKYASKIAADAISKTIPLTKILEGNSKSPTYDVHGAYYMPGEIYSFAAVYIFDDNTLSPAFHIPGKSSLLTENKIFTVGAIPMSKINNTSDDTEYTDNDICGNNSSWGVDSEGVALINEPVRHHRFPLRSAVNLPYVTKIEEENVTVPSIFQKLKINISGTLTTPVLCAKFGYPGYVNGCVDGVVPAFQFRITYTVDGIINYYIHPINPADYGGDASEEVSINLLSEAIDSENVVLIKIEEELVLLTSVITGGISLTSSTSAKNLVYKVDVIEEISVIQEDMYQADVFGIRFSNIEIPSLIDTNGHKVIGYYIVRHERTEDNKTILDSAVLTSMIKNKHFVSHGLLMPELTPEVLDDKIKKDIYSFINPEFKFNNIKYTNFDIKQQGKFTQVDNIKSRVKVNDVLDGSSYDSNKHKGGRPDSDGWQLQIKTRDNITSYSNTSLLNISKGKMKDVFYLPALGDKEMTDSGNVGVDVFNLACDNQIGIIALNEEVVTPIVNTIPYVYLVRDLANPYSNFRITPYYKENMNPIYFGIGTSTCDIFSGDSHIAPIRYTNSIFYDNRIRLHAGQTSAWAYIAGAALVVIAVVATVISLGALAPAGAALVVAASAIAAGGAALVGAGTALILSGIKQDAYNKSYSKLYKEGLKETIEDDYLKYDGTCKADIESDDCMGYIKNPSDDEIQWLGESINLWFESKVNMSLRHGASDGTPSFLNAPGNKQVVAVYPEQDDEYFGTHSVSTKTIAPRTALDIHMLSKLTYLDVNRKGSRAYFGLALAELYLLNPDYTRINKQKLFDHLPLEYDCCSDCLETFPHRIIYSLQSFQEELTDNFRKFLPNNYRDIEGETGRITDVFRIQNKLYLHTEEALWELPQNYQERVTGEILSFLGTGEYFNVPPRKMMDDSQSSAGNIHKWARLKMKYGVLFPCHKEKKWYLFDGQKLDPISDTQMGSEFKKNMNFSIEDKYYSDNRKPYPYLNNPSNPLGVGYISTYDTKNERLIVTKKDFQISNLPTSDYEIRTGVAGTFIFNNISTIISTQQNLGWRYLGIEDTRMKFGKLNVTQETSVYIYNYVNGTAFVPVYVNNSYTMSYSLKDQQWVSWHSYLPSFYFHVQEKFYSWKQGSAQIYRHNRKNHYRTFYGVTAPFIIEYVDNDSALNSKIHEGIILQTEAKVWDTSAEEYLDKRDITFNKILVYNTSQISGVLNMLVKQDNLNYINEQINNTSGTITIDRNERNWNINELRDMSIDTSVAMFKRNLTDIQSNYYIDKIVNPSRINMNKSWMEMESFRDKFLVVRLIFDTFTDTRLIMNFSVQDSKQSER